MKRLALMALTVSLAAGCGGGAGNVDSGPTAPAFTIVENDDGTKVAQIDQAAYEAFCSEHGLPEPPEPSEVDHLAFGFIHEANTAAAREKTVQTLSDLAFYYDGNAMRESALACYEMLIELEPEAPHWWHLAGRIHQNNDPNAAVEHLRKAVELMPDNAAGYARLGDQLLDLDDVGGAEEAYERAADTMGDDPNVRFGLARVAIAQEDWDLAKTRVEAVLELNPDFKPAVNQMATVLRERGEMDEARRWLDRANTLEEAMVPAPADRITRAMMERSKSADFYKAIMESFFAQGKYHEAYIAILQILERQPNLAVYQRNAAALAKLNGRLDNAIQHAHRAVELNQGYATGHTVLGELLRDAGRYDEAMESIRTAIELEPEDTEHNIALAAVMVAAEQYDEALAEVEIGLANSPDHVTALCIKAQALTDLDRRNDARTAVERVLALDAQNTWALQLKAKLGF